MRFSNVSQMKNLKTDFKQNKNMKKAVKQKTKKDNYKLGTKMKLNQLPKYIFNYVVFKTI